MNDIDSLAQDVFLSSSLVPVAALVAVSPDRTENKAVPKGVNAHSIWFCQRLGGVAPMKHTKRIDIVNDFNLAAAARQRMCRGPNEVGVTTEVMRRVEGCHHGESQTTFLSRATRLAGV